MRLSSTKRAYLAGFLDGDGSVYVRAKPNASYRFGFQVAPYIVLFQSAKEKKKFKEVCSLIGFGRMRERKDGIVEYVIGRLDDVKKFINLVKPYSVLKRDQIVLLEEILIKKEKIKNEKDFQDLLDLIDAYRTLNYSAKRKKRKLTP